MTMMIFSNTHCNRGLNLDMLQLASTRLFGFTRWRSVAALFLYIWQIYPCACHHSLTFSNFFFLLLLFQKGSFQTLLCGRVREYAPCLIAFYAVKNTTNNLTFNSLKGK